ncbi:CPBP family intramembrane glutamic endopeptidase [Ferdinandcohnia quinoae]|uniref:CPBP family intramembrane metalloprotease n=1 Tax=Fredinandcohnia quinoae TaxID=2918902 RepID=A0AAW5EBF2_9BACI|nr:type II CAAX endopeptidase family protein [Fredinandcohnia sp. SECRCQ15]MCH1627202.1 CPBP family intramembrane metalloprotease [Fredinandcohnia sp. SECRCQ15]
MAHYKLQKKEFHQGKKKLWLYSFIQFPLVWMVLGAIVIILADSQLSSLVGGSKGFESIGLAIVECAVAVILYLLTMKCLANRRVSELALKSAIPEVAFGVLIGLIFISISTLIIFLLDGYSFKWLSASVSSVLLPAIATALGAAFVEELLFRGIAFQAIESMIGRWTALAVTSLFFGIAHLGNPGATIWSAVAIVIQAGVLLGSAFLWRRSLWFVIGIHFAWNAIEELLGIPVSGHPSTGLFSAEVTGPFILTGGDFGIEASVVPVIISLLLAIPMLILAKTNKKQS